MMNGAGSRHLFPPAVREGQDQGFRLIGYDRPGCGGSTSLPGRRIADYARDIRAIMTDLGVSRAATEVHRRLDEVTPVRGDDEKQTAESERDARDDPSCGASLQRRDFGGDEPDTGEQDKQEPHFGDDHAGVRREPIG